MGKGLFISGGIFLVLVIAFGYFFVAGISDTKIDSFEVRNIREVNAGGFTFDAILGIYNPSKALVPILSIDYNATLERTNRQIASGSFEPFTLDPQGVTEIPVESRISWVPTANMATDLLVAEEVWLRIDGVAVIGTDDIGISLPFSDRYDIASYIRRFAPAVPGGEIVQRGTDEVLDESETAGIFGENSMLS